MNRNALIAFLEEEFLPRKILEIPSFVNFGLEIEGLISIL